MRDKGIWINFKNEKKQVYQVFAGNIGDYAEQLADTRASTYTYDNNKICCIYCFERPFDTLNIDHDPTMNPLRTTQLIVETLSRIDMKDPHLYDKLDELGRKLSIQVPIIAVTFLPSS